MRKLVLALLLVPASCFAHEPGYKDIYRQTVYQVHSDKPGEQIARCVTKEWKKTYPEALASDLGKGEFVVGAGGKYELPYILYIQELKTGGSDLALKAKDGLSTPPPEQLKAVLPSCI